MDYPKLGSVAEHNLSTQEVERYSRQLLLPQFGVTSQEKLKQSRVLIVGVGGLGCPAALYLAGSGIGTIGIVDRPDDVVEKSNLHRQIAHSEPRIGTNKVESAAIAIQALNSMVKIEKHSHIDQSNAVELVSSFDAVLDCTDNVVSRYLVSDACSASKIPLISGAAIGLDGQLTVYCKDDETPCYRCIFPKPPPPSCVGSCDSAGVLGPVPGIIGTMQALEAVKILGDVRHCQSLVRKMLLFDGSDCSFRTMKLRPRSKMCVACGNSPSIDVKNFDYEKFAHGSSCSGDVSAISSIERLSPKQFAALRGNGEYKLIDVRPKEQFNMCHLEEALSLPVSSTALLDELKSLNSSERIIFICRRGNASQRALQRAAAEGLMNITDVIGGLEAWHRQIDKSFPLY